jgi:serine/threonine protein kinase
VLDKSAVNTSRMSRFEQEYEYTRNARVDFIVPALDYGLAPSGAPFFAMPFVGASLRSVIGSVPHEKAIVYLSQIVRALEYAHGLGVVHRDLKPENILIDEQRSHARLADFGIAHFTSDVLVKAHETNDSEKLANFKYAAPEQRERGYKPMPQADVFAIGLMANELFTGRLGLGRDAQTVSSVSQEYGFLDAVIDKALQDDPQRRYSDASELRTDLEARIKLAESGAAKRRLQSELLDVDDTAPQAPQMVLESVDWVNELLILYFREPVPRGWIDSFRKMGGFKFLPGKRPEMYRFEGNTASIPAAANQVKQLVELFKDWVARANGVHQRTVRAAHEQKRTAARRQREKDIAMEEARQRLLAQIRL